MSNKNKICNAALATHIEQCFDSYSFAPFLINRSIKPPRGKPSIGLVAVIKDELRQLESNDEAKINRLQNEKSAEFLAAELIANMDGEIGVDCAVKGEEMSSLKSSIIDSISRVREVRDKEEKANIAKLAGPSFDLANPSLALTARTDQMMDQMDIKHLRKSPFELEEGYNLKEFPQLGIFFSEATCFECQGITYSPCGHESTILPHETISSKMSQDETISTERDESEDVETDIAITDKSTVDTTLVQSYEKKIQETLDVKKSIKGSVSGKLFKLLDVSLNSDTSVNFKRYVERINKSTLTEKNTIVHDVVRKFNLTRSLNSSETYT